MTKSFRGSIFVPVLCFAVWFALSVPLAWADGETGTVAVSASVNPGLMVRGSLDGTTVDEWAGTIYLDITGGSRTSTFCTDIEHSIYNGTKVAASDQEMDCRIRWLLLHYPPRFDATDYQQNDTSSGRLADVRQEMAARQAVVWYFSDNFVVMNTSPTPPGVYARTQVIIADVNAQADPCSADAPDVAITPSSSTQAAGAAASFTARLTQGDQPVAGRLVTLQTSLGTLDPPAITTDANGEATFTITSAVTGTARITATAQMSLPIGTIFVGVEPNVQKIVLGHQADGPVVGRATVTWVTGGTIVAHVFDDLNMNGAPEDGEPGQSGWTVAVQGSGQRTTDANGNATWNLPPGTYTVVLTQRSGWYATSPITASVSLSHDSIVQINFGQIKLPVVKVKVFQDSDLSASLTSGDSDLAGWTVGLYRQDGSQAAGWNAATDGQGWVYLSNDPARNPPDLTAGNYYVQEILQDGWVATTGISRSFSLASGETHTEYLGNLQASAAIEIVVTAGDTPDGHTRLVHDGEPVIYHYRVTNVGNTYLTSVQITDDPFGTICAIAGPIAPGATATCDHTAALSASTTNVGTATGNPALASGADLADLPNASDTDDASVDVLHPALEATITPSINSTYAGEPVLLTYEAANAGDTILYDVDITSDNGTPGDPTDDYVVRVMAELGVGETITSSEWVVPATEVTYTATATGHDVLGQNVEDQAATTIDIIPSEPGDPDDDGDPDYLDTDSDGDGILDTEEGTGDTDGDGLPNYLDTDSDGDGILDIIEGTADVDGDGKPNYLDADSDGDGILDATEGTADVDGDGKPNYLDTDSDGDGILDATEGTADVDGDGKPNYLDTDSDGDGIPDATEGTPDVDGDGKPNYLDTDSDGDGIPDTTERTADPDRDGKPNYLDADSDGDGISDGLEWNTDADGDGDKDSHDRDADGDGTPNFLDLDSDGDGKPDAQEGTGDADQDGIPNYLDPVDGTGTTGTGLRLYLPLVAFKHRFQ